MEAESIKSLKRPYEDLVHFTVAVERTYLSEYADDGYFEKERDHRLYSMQGCRGQTFKDVLDEKNLKSMGVVGDYELIFKVDGAWGRKGIIMSKDFDVHFAVNHYKCADEKRTTFTLKPKAEIWYKCVALTAEEIEAAKKVVDEVDKRLCKRLKETHNL